MLNNKYYNDFYSEHGSAVHDDPIRFAKLASLCQGRTLDVACGSGTLADYFSGDYVGFDFSEIAIEQARAVRRKDAEFYVSDLFEFFKQDHGKFDTIVLAEFLEHIEKSPALFSMLKNAASPNCRFIVSVPNGDRVPDESHCRTFTVPEIRKEFSELGTVKFHNWEGFKDRIIFTVEQLDKNENDVSLVMIVKDEEVGLETAVLSAIEFVDNIVISVDSKSSDKTAAIAKLYADELKFHEWKDDFSAARNFAQENVKTKWILALDGHEYVEKTGNVRSLMASDVEGVLTTMRMENGLIFHFPRLYRSYIQFKYAVHNLNECKTTVQCDDFIIVHDRLHLQSKEAIIARQKQRDQMLPRIMGDMLKKNPKHTRALFHMGNFHMMRQNWKEAISYYKRYLKYTDFKDEAYLVLLNVAICRQMRGQLFRAYLSLTKAEKLLPGRWETARLIGGNYFADKNFSEALKWLVKSLDNNTQKYHYEPFEKDLFEVWDLIAGCLIALSKNEEAVLALQRALELAANDVQKKLIEQKIAFVKMLIG